MITVIIPTFNEEYFIESALKQLKILDIDNLISEIIVADGNSTDNTRIIAIRCGATVLVCPKRGRSAQMNYAATLADENVLYFIHADTNPPKNFTTAIYDAVKLGFNAGSFRLKFDYDHWFLKVNAWFTRFNIDSVRFGDQSLFVTKKTFKASGGFLESLVVMEDQHIITKLKKLGSFKLIQKSVVTSSRKYLENGIFKTQGVFFIIFLMYKFGFSQATLVNTYRKMLKQDKV